MNQGVVNTKKIISLFLVLAIFIVSVPYANASEQNPFDLNALQKALQSLTKEYGEKKLYDASLVSISNQLFRLNKEIEAGKKPRPEADIKTALTDADKILRKLDTSKLSVYVKKMDTVKKDKEGAADTAARIEKVRNKLFKAMVYYGLKPLTLDEEVYEGTEPWTQITRKWYDSIITGLKQDPLSKTVMNKRVTAEYRVVSDVSFLGYFYYSLQVFSDGTGEFHYMVHQWEDFKEGKIVLNKKKSLNKDEVGRLTGIIAGNDFFNIPTVHPDEMLGLDGSTVFIEGYSKGKHHFISMWEPDKKYGIYKIEGAFSAFADTVAERPDIMPDW